MMPGQPWISGYDAWPRLMNPGGQKMDNAS
jgi:hypothetical protein